MRHSGSFAALLALAAPLVPAAAAAQPASPVRGFTACCPPWNARELQAALSVQPTGPALGPFRIRFTPAAAQHVRLNAYAAYLRSLGMGFTRVGIFIQLVDSGNGATPVAGGNVIGLDTVHWTGSGTPATAFFANVLSVNRWYRVETRFLIDGGPSNAFVSARCIDTFVHIRLQAGVIGGAGQGGVIQFRFPDGRAVTRPLRPARAGVAER